MLSKFAKSYIKDTVRRLSVGFVNRFIVHDVGPAPVPRSSLASSQ